jgi:hypothetical protein
MANLLTRNSRYTEDAESITKKTKEFVKQMLYEFDKSDYPHHEWDFVLKHAVDTTLTSYLLLKLYPIPSDPDDQPPEWPPKPENWD